MILLFFYFGPFGADRVNSSEEAARHLPDDFMGHDILLHRLPVSFRRSVEEAKEIVMKLHPDMVFCLGQGASRSGINLEQVAVNSVHAVTCADNDGYMPQDGNIVEDGPEMYISPLPLDEISGRLREKGYQVVVSRSAGRYVCNCLYYSLLHAFGSLPVLFIHIPLTPGQACARTGCKASPMPPEIAARTICEVIAQLLVLG